MKEFHKSSQKLKELLEIEGLKLLNPYKHIEDELENYYNEYTSGGLNLSYRHLAEQCLIKSNPSYSQALKAVRMHKGYTPNHSQYLGHPRRFNAKYVDYLWHTDIHYLKVQEDGALKIKYCLAFLDDASRFIIRICIIEDKTSMSCALVFANLLEELKPKVLTSDNGGEFIGHEFQTVLKAKNVKHWKTDPHTPQQNGKMERWWKTLEGARGSDYSLSSVWKIVDLYNNVWVHKALKMTPAQARIELEQIPHSISENIYENLEWFDP
jgi:transposase InsO family protein